MPGLPCRRGDNNKAGLIASSCWLRREQLELERERLQSCN
jgi:hypothetical protein